jgi:hypothetical protein
VLRPQARRTVAIRPEVQDPCVWRPTWRLAITAATTHSVRAPHRTIARWRQACELGRTCRSGVERDPSVRRESRVVDPWSHASTIVFSRRANFHKPTPEGSCDVR